MSILQRNILMVFFFYLGFFFSKFIFFWKFEKLNKKKFEFFKKIWLFIYVLCCSIRETLHLYHLVRWRPSVQIHSNFLLSTLLCTIVTISIRERCTFHAQRVGISIFEVVTSFMFHNFLMSTPMKKVTSSHRGFWWKFSVINNS